MRYSFLCRMKSAESLSRLHAETAFIESFNGQLLDGCLNVRQFASIGDTQAKIECVGWTTINPGHGSLGHRRRPSARQRQVMITAEAAPV